MRLTDADELSKKLIPLVKNEIDNSPTFSVDGRKMTLTELKDMRNSIDWEIIKIEDENKQKFINEKEQLVGKCYQYGDVDKSFFKVISKYGEEFDEVTVLRFSMPIRYKFGEIYDSSFHRHKFCYNFEFQEDTVESKDVGFLKCNCKEITEEEFNKAAHEYMKQLLLVCRELKER